MGSIRRMDCMIHLTYMGHMGCKGHMDCKGHMGCIEYMGSWESICMIHLSSIGQTEIKKENEKKLEKKI